MVVDVEPITDQIQRGMSDGGVHIHRQNVYITPISKAGGYHKRNIISARDWSILALQNNECLLEMTGMLQS